MRVDYSLYMFKELGILSSVHLLGGECNFRINKTQFISPSKSDLPQVTATELPFEFLSKFLLQT
jgi:hypothetical protein